MIRAPDPSPIGDALAWAARIMAIGIEMFVPGVIGTWLDQRYELGVLGPACFLLGLSASLIWLVKIGGNSKNRRSG